MDAMCTAYAKGRTQSEHISNWVEENNHGIHASIVKGKHALFANNILFGWNCLMNLVVKVLLKCVIHFFISFPWYAFPNFRTQISRPLAYSAHISSKAGGTAGTCNIHIQLCSSTNLHQNISKSQSGWIKIKIQIFCWLCQWGLLKSTVRDLVPIIQCSRVKGLGAYKATEIGVLVIRFINSNVLYSCIWKAGCVIPQL